MPDAFYHDLGKRRRAPLAGSSPASHMSDRVDAARSAEDTPKVTLHQSVTAAQERLVQAGISVASAGLDAEVLARHVLGWDRATYLSNRHEVASASFQTQYVSLVTRRERREPLPFITGEREFWGLNFEVTRDVLIPRPETELILEEAQQLLAAPTSIRHIIDAGTGCGCLAIALALECETVRLTGTDISPKALNIARRNAGRHGVGDRITLVQTNYLANIEKVADLIVSNPPYVPAAVAEALQPEVRDYEPAIAVISGHDGLEGMRELITQVEPHLRPSGWCIFEFGDGQEDSIKALIDACPRLTLLKVRSDLKGIPRTAVVQRT